MELHPMGAEDLIAFKTTNVKTETKCQQNVTNVQDPSQNCREKYENYKNYRRNTHSILMK